jgi:hypothetical protein
MGLELTGAIYLFCLVVGLGLLVVSGLLGHLSGGDADAGGLDHGVGFDHDVGIDHDVGMDHDVGVDHDVGAGVDHDGGLGGVHLSMWSAPVLSTLLVFFGGTGIILENGFGIKAPMITVPISIGTGLAFSLAVLILLSKLMTSMTGTTHQSLNECVGMEAEVVTPIPADGVGEVAYNLTTGRRTSPARSDEGVMIPGHSMVRICKVVGGTAVVRALVEERLRDLRAESDSTDASSEELGEPDTAASTPEAES